jgi:hypothetical protein
MPAFKIHCCDLFCAYFMFEDRLTNQELASKKMEPEGPILTTAPLESEALKLVTAQATALRLRAVKPRPASARPIRLSMPGSGT